MPKVTRRFSLRATVAGAITGVVSFTGLAVAADTSSALLYGAGAGVAAIGLVVGSRRLRGSAANLSFNPDLAAGGPRRASAIDSPNGKVAAIHSVETHLARNSRIAKFGLTVVDRQFRESSCTTSTRASPGPKVLESAVGDRRMATVEEVHRLPGAVIMPFKDSKLQQYGKTLATEISQEIPPERIYTVPRTGVVSRGMVTVCFCAAFAVFGTATGVLIPDTTGLGSSISSAVTSVTDDDSTDSETEIDSAIGQFGLDALNAMKARAEKDVPGSTKHVLEVTFYGYWTELLVLDEKNAQRVTYHASQDENGNFDPDRVDVAHSAKNADGARLRNSFPLSAIDMKTIVGAYDTISKTVSVAQTGNDRVSIHKETGDGVDTEPMVDVSIDSKSYAVKLDGTIAPIFDVSDTAAALAQVASALPLAGIDAATPLISNLCIACNSADRIGLAVYPAVEGGDQTGVSMRSGSFPTVTIDKGVTPVPDKLFSLSQITAAQLDSIATANANRVGAESADLVSVRFEITRAPLPATDYDYDAPTALQVKVKFGSMNDSDAIYLPDGTFVTTDD